MQGVKTFGKMTTKRRKFTNKFKAMVALAAIREQKTLAELSKEIKVSPNQISQWKQEAIRNMEKAFGEKGKEKTEEDEKSIRKMREKVGELTIERDFYNTERHHQGIGNEILERKYENNKLLIRTHEAA